MALGESGVAADVAQALPPPAKGLLRVCRSELVSSGTQGEDRPGAWSSVTAIFLSSGTLRPTRRKNFRDATLHARIQKLYLRCVFSWLSDHLRERDARHASVAGCKAARR